MIVDKPFTCNSTDRILIIAKSGASKSDYYSNRQETRNTWMEDAKLLNIPVLFALAKPENLSFQDLIQEEDHQFNDLIQFDFIDHYYNLTLKTINVFKWASFNCPQINCFTYVDDDI